MRVRMAASIPLAAMNVRYAAAVVANPSGTRTPSLWRVRMSSPSEAFFPPTRGTSAMPISSNHITGDSAMSALLCVVGGPILRGTGVPGSGALDPRAAAGSGAA